MKLGILGSGQLARMLSLSAHSLGIETLCYSPEQECASQVTQWMAGDYSSASLQDFARQVDVITLENENIDAKVIQLLLEKVNVYPGIDALTAAQDRLFEKNLFVALDIPTPKFCAVEDLSSVYEWIETHGLPAVIKTRRFGYDGRGQAVIRHASELEAVWSTFGSNSLIIESFVPFDYEVSLLVARNVAGMVRFYPLAKNQHADGILRISKPIENPTLFQLAQEYVLRLVEKLNYVGVLAVEFFVQQDQLFANEMAPRVHNTGHWSMNGCMTSQFNQHVRAVFNLPLGETTVFNAVTMYNCIGTLPDLTAVLRVPGANFHVYGKSPRSGRKLGHINVLDQNDGQYFEHCHQISELTGSNENCL